MNKKINEDKYYLFCDEAGNENKACFCCTVIKKNNLNNIKNEIIRLNNQIFENYNIHFHSLKKNNDKKKKVLLDIIEYLFNNKDIIDIFVLKVENSNWKKEKNIYHNFLINEVFEKKQIIEPKIFIDKYDNIEIKKKCHSIYKTNSKHDIKIFLSIPDIISSCLYDIYRDTNKEKKEIINKLKKIIEVNANWLKIIDNKLKRTDNSSNRAKPDTPIATVTSQQPIISHKNNNCQDKNEKNLIKKPIKTTDFNALNNEILSHRLSDVIGRYCHLIQEGGGRKKCRCPFHHEKTPSFYLDDNKGLWHCFGCGEGGNVFTFIQKIKGCDFPKAVDELCEIFGIDKNKYITIKNTEEIEKSKNFYQTMDIVAEFYKTNLKNNKEALDYLHLIRDLDDKTLEEFSFGLAGNDINEILEYCKNKGVDEKNLIDCGIIKEGENKKKYLFFKDRIMIPIHNTQGKIVAFGGRIYKTGDENAKYLNSSENDYFKKGNILFNFNRAKTNLNRDNYLIIVEGYMDAISLYKYGFKTAIAPLGTSITENHLKIILNYCTIPLFLFDSDNAGKKASMRACEMLFSMIHTGIIPKFCTLQDAKDVDEFLKKYTKEDLKKQFDNARDINNFLFEQKIQNFNTEDPNQMSIFQKEILTINEKISDNTLKKNYKSFFLDNFNKITQNKSYVYKKNKFSKQNNNYLFNKIKQTFYKTNIDFLEKQIIAFLLKNYNNETLLKNPDIFEKIILKLKNQNQSIIINLIEQKNEEIKKIFCEKYLSSNDLKLLNNINNIDNDYILEQLMNNLENQKNNLLNDKIRQIERKKIIDKKKKILSSYEES